MGVQLSKMRAGESPPIMPLPASLPYTSELSSYDNACEQDPDLQTFDTMLRDRTSRVISNLAVGVEVRSLSFDSLKDVTGCLLDMNQEVVKIILDCKTDIWRNQDLFELVEEYFENSLQTLDFCTVLEKCLKRARDSQLIILFALQQFDEEGAGDAAGSEEKRRHWRTLEKLNNFKAAGDPFTDEFFHVFQSVYKQQVLMLEKLQHCRSKIGKRIRSIKAWRKVSCIIFASAFAALLICSVVVAAVAAPPVAAALAAAIPLGSMGKWLDSLWKGYEVALKGQKQVLNSIHVGTFVVMKDLDGIRVLVDRLETEIKSLEEKAAFGVENEEALRIVIAEIRKTLGVFMKSIEDLGEHADNCSRDIRRARTVVLQRIIKHPNQN